jgi:hypothetical protein
LEGDGEGGEERECEKGGVRSYSDFQCERGIGGVDGGVIEVKDKALYGDGGVFAT